MEKPGTDNLNGTDLVLVARLVSLARYRLRHRSAGQRLDRESVLVYLGQGDHPHILEFDQEYRKGRRPRGVVKLSVHSIASASRVADDATTYVNRLLRRR